MRYISLHFIPFRYISFCTFDSISCIYCISLRVITLLHFNTFGYVSLHFITFHYIFYISLGFTTFHFTSLHFATFRYISLHFITFGYISLHFVIFSLHFITTRHSILCIALFTFHDITLALHSCMLDTEMHRCRCVHLLIDTCTSLETCMHTCIQHPQPITHTHTHVRVCVGLSLDFQFWSCFSVHSLHVRLFPVPLLET